MPVKEQTLAQRSDGILDAAIQVFAQQGFAAADVQVIADNAGVGKGTVYRHFGSKEKLFLAAADWGLQQLREAVDAAAEKVDRPLDKLRAGSLAFLTFFDENPRLLEIVIQVRAHFRDQPPPNFFGRQRDEGCQRWQDRIQTLIDQGIVRDLPVQQIMECLGKFLYGTVFVNYMAGREQPLVSQCEDVVDLMFHGILRGDGGNK